MRPGISHLEGGVAASRGFVCAGVSAGIKSSGKKDVALLVAEKPCPVAAVFTTNSMAAAPVVVSREHAASRTARAVVVNSGNANACTGPEGERDARAMADRVALAIGCDASDVLVASTGVIGVPLPLPRVLQGIDAAADHLGAEGGAAVAAAIMTTDTFSKETAVAVEAGGATYRVGGTAKGSGMIMPDMATMLAFVTTDAPLTAGACDRALRSATARTFNRITVDGDTSTNDMVVLLASGAGGGAPIDPGDSRFERVSSAIETVCEELARMIVRDGEGATKLITVTVRGARTEDDAQAAAFSIANSPLFKTAMYGQDANWGRVVMAAGKSSAYVDPGAIEVVFAGITVCKDGTGYAFDEDDAARALAEDEVDVVVDLHVGEAQATVLTCDLSHDYVRINGEYRT